MQKSTEDASNKLPAESVGQVNDKLPLKPLVNQPNRFSLFIQSLVRWALTILLLIGAGYLLAFFTLYTPRTQALTQAGQAREAELAQVRLHALLLTARSDIADARLAVLKKDAARARLALNSTSVTLKELESLLPVDYRSLVVEIQERLGMALKEVGVEDSAAEADLSVAANDLVEIENALFVKP